MYLLLQDDLTMEIVDEDGQTALMLACKDGCEVTEVEELLVRAGAEVNARDAFGRTPLMWACKDGCQATVVELLIKAGAKVNARERDGSTALTKACAGNHIEVAQVLLTNGADVNLKGGQLILTPFDLDSFLHPGQESS